MNISDLKKALHEIEEKYGDIDVLVLARDSGGDYNEYLPVEGIDICENIYDCSNEFYAEAAII